MKTLFVFFSLLLAGFAHAQLEVGIDFKRKTFLRGEPIEVKVSVRNLSGHDVTLSDGEFDQWFGFEVIRGSDTPIPPTNLKYKNAPISILNGETVSRTVDLLSLYPVNEFGPYKVRAAIYFHETKKYHSSEQVQLEISDGRKVWGQTVGVPNGKEGAGELREFSLLTFQTPKELQLYCRVTDEGTGTILATYPIGRILGGAKPMVEFSDDNTLHAFHMTGPSVYALSKVGVNGEWMGQTLWNSPRGRATVRKKADGTMVVVGASRDRSEQNRPNPATIPRLSDAPPVALPVER